MHRKQFDQCNRDALYTAKFAVRKEKRMGGLYQRKTENYPLDEVVSALQKCIRRGLTREAVWFAKELLRSKFGWYAWRRLLVIASEDIGPANNEIAILVGTLYQSALAVTDKARPNGDDWKKAEVQMVHAVYALCSAKKSRIIADICCVLEERYAQGERLEIPDWALDCHTARGRRLGRAWSRRAGVKFWQEHGRVVRPERVIEDNRWRQELDELWDKKHYKDDAKTTRPRSNSKSDKEG